MVKSKFNLDIQFGISDDFIFITLLHITFTRLALHVVMITVGLINLFTT
jgi:hypothetical protein